MSTFTIKKDFQIHFGSRWSYDKSFGDRYINSTNNDKIHHFIMELKVNMPLYSKSLLANEILASNQDSNRQDSQIVRIQLEFPEQKHDLNSKTEKQITFLVSKIGWKLYFLPTKWQPIAFLKIVLFFFLKKHVYSKIVEEYEPNLKKSGNYRQLDVQMMNFRFKSLLDWISNGFFLEIIRFRSIRTKKMN